MTTSLGLGAEFRRPLIVFRGLAWAGDGRSPEARRGARAGTPAALALCVLLVATLSLAVARAAPNFPALTGRVVDAADLLSVEDERALSIDLEALEEKTSDQLVVVTLPSLQGYTIEEFGYQLGRAWGIGQAGKDNGVLLIVAPNERKVRIEVGYGLEGRLTDALTKVIIENAILPRFRAGDFAGGIRAGVRDIVTVLSGDADSVAQRARSRPDADAQLVTLLVMLAWFAIFGLVLWSILQSARPGAGGRRGRGWSGGSGSGWSGGGGGGGFSGGGGSFGGGGSSGSW